MWDLPDPNNIDPVTQKFIDELKAETDQLKKDSSNLTIEEFDKRQKEILDKAFPQPPERPDLLNGWLQPDGTFYRLLKADWHEMWSLKKFGIRHRELMYQGWVKITQWDRMDKAIGMHFYELTPEQEIKLKELNVKCSEISRFY